MRKNNLRVLSSIKQSVLKNILRMICLMANEIRELFKNLISEEKKHYGRKRTEHFTEIFSALSAHFLEQENVFFTLKIQKIKLCYWNKFPN